MPLLLICNGVCVLNREVGRAVGAGVGQRGRGPEGILHKVRLLQCRHQSHWWDFQDRPALILSVHGPYLPRALEVSFFQRACSMICGPCYAGGGDKLCAIYG